MKAVQIGEHLFKVKAAIKRLPNILREFGLQKDGKTSTNDPETDQSPMSVVTPASAKEVSDLVSNKLKVLGWGILENNARMENIQAEMLTLEPDEDSLDDKPDPQQIKKRKVLPHLFPYI
jgi:hypothetical protein